MKNRTRRTAFTYRVGTASEKKKKASFIRRFFNCLYPAHDEIAIFSAAVGLIALVLLSADFRSALLFMAGVIFVEFPGDGFESSIWKGLWYSFGALMISLCCIASLVISFRLPFTHRRLDVWVEPLLLVHIFLIFGSNVLAFNQRQDMLSGLIFLFSFLYLFVFLVGHRFRLLRLEVSDRQATAREAFIAAATVTVLVAVLILALKIHWAHCYAMSTAFAVGMARIFDAVSE